MSTLTNINAGDLITNSRATINDNFNALNTDKLETSVLDTDTTLAANSDAKVATQKAVKAYVDAGGQANASETVKGIVEEATNAEVLAGTAIGATGARLFVNPEKISAIKPVTTTYDFAGSPHTWTKLTGLVKLTVQAWGGGGSGGRADSEESGGGGGGAYVEYTFNPSQLASTETVTIGAGGAAISGALNSGNAGGNTTFGSLITAYGGGAGAATSSGAAGGGGGGLFSAGSGATPGSPGSPFSGTGGAIGVAGGDGQISGGGGGAPTSGDGLAGGRSLYGGGGGGGQKASGGAGGTSVFGGNGGAGNNAGAATAGSVPGGGGGASSGGNSGAGGAGRVIVTEYYV